MPATIWAWTKEGQEELAMPRGAKKMNRQEFFESVIARFWSYVDRKGPDDCWLWTSTSGAEHEYGLFGIWNGTRSVSYRAHRVAWMLTNGAIPDGLVVMHSCDTPLCVNPSHLSVGTMADEYIEAETEHMRDRETVTEQESVDPTKCPICGGPTTHDRSVPPNPYLCDDCNMNAALDELDESEKDST